MHPGNLHYWALAIALTYGNARYKVHSFLQKHWNSWKYRKERAEVKRKYLK